MAGGATSNRSVSYAAAQTSLGVAATLAITDAVRVISQEWEPIYAPIERQTSAQPTEGGEKPLAGAKAWRVRTQFELRCPDTAGDRSTWQALPLLQACPVSITDATSPSRVEVLPVAGRVPMVDLVPVTLRKVEQNGRSMEGYDFLGVIDSIDLQPNGVPLVTTTHIGTFSAVEQWDADDDAQVDQTTVTTGDAADWSVVITDESGDSESYTVSGDATAATVAGNIRTALAASGIVNVSGSGADVILTGVVKGRTFTTSVTPGGSGAITGPTTTTPPLSWSKSPTYQNDDGAVCVYNGASVSDTRGTILRAGAANLSPGVAIAERLSGGDANGYGLPTVAAGGYCELSFEHDVQPNTVMDTAGYLVGATDIGFSITVTDRFMLALASAKLKSSGDTDRSGARGYSDTLIGYGNPPWSLTLYG